MKKIFFTAVLLLFIYSCREEVIPPGNPSGNINQPVIDKFLNSFSLVINAQNITYNMSEYMNFNNRKTEIYISVFDHTSGYVEVLLFGKSRQILYRKKAEDDISGESVQVQADIPESVTVDFRQFTGKLKLTVNHY